MKKPLLTTLVALLAGCSAGGSAPAPVTVPAAPAALVNTPVSLVAPSPTAETVDELGPVVVSIPRPAPGRVTPMSPPGWSPGCWNYYSSTPPDIAAIGATAAGSSRYTVTLVWTSGLFGWRILLATSMNGPFRVIADTGTKTWAANQAARYCPTDVAITATFVSRSTYYFELETYYYGRPGSNGGISGQIYATGPSSVVSVKIPAAPPTPQPRK